MEAIRSSVLLKIKTGSSITNLRAVFLGLIAGVVQTPSSGQKNYVGGIIRSEFIFVRSIYRHFRWLFSVILINYFYK